MSQSTMQASSPDHPIEPLQSRMECRKHPVLDQFVGHHHHHHRNHGMTAKLWPCWVCGWVHQLDNSLGVNSLLTSLVLSSFSVTKPDYCYHVQDSNNTHKYETSGSCACFPSALGERPAFSDTPILRIISSRWIIACFCCRTRGRRRRGWRDIRRSSRRFR